MTSASVATSSPALVMKRRLRVGFWSPNYLPDLGGQQSSSHRTALALNLLGTSTVIYARDYGAPHRDDHRLGVRRIESGLEDFAAVSSQELLHRRDFDVLQCTDIFRSDLPTQLRTVAVLSRNGVPAILRIPTIGKASQYFGSATARRGLNSFAAFVVLSGAMRTELEELGIPEHRIHYIANGVQMDLFRPVQREEKLALRRRFGLPAESFVVAYVGRVDERKCLDLLFSAFSSLPGDDLRLLIVGADLQKSPTDGELVRRASRQDGRVILVGRTDNPIPYYQAADVFVLASSSEGQPNALIEAMACGIPVVASAIPGVEECVTDGVEGLVFDVGDAAGLRAALERMKSSDRLRGSMAIAARSRACVEHDILSTARQYQQLYVHLLLRSDRRLGRLAEAIP